MKTSVINNADEITEYIEKFPEHVQKRLSIIRSIIKEVCPKATEKISWGMPGYKYCNMYLVYFCAFKNHIGLYLMMKDYLEQFAEELKPYKLGKGTIQFAHLQELPVELIKKIVASKMINNEKEFLLKKKK
jgi:uncharacterized protein YdhG (YjbR/CyaY superfamily)